jgi:hypothetical protein
MESRTPPENLTKTLPNLAVLSRQTLPEGYRDYQTLPNVTQSNFSRNDLLSNEECAVKKTT